MGLVIALESRRTCSKAKLMTKPVPAEAELPLVLSRLLAAGATDFARVALDAWGNHELEPEELLELCSTYAAVAGLESIS